MEKRRTSINSDSSVEPMDISTKTTSSTDQNSSAAIKSSDQCDSDYFESDRDDRRPQSGNNNNNNHSVAEEADAEHDDDDDDSGAYKYQSFVKRENLRHLETSMMVMRKKFRHSMPITKNNNNTYDYDKMHQTNRIQSVATTTDYDTNDNKVMEEQTAKTEIQYNCPICDNVSQTQHEFTEHIRSHNNADDTQNFTCKICFKVKQTFFDFFLLKS